MTRPPTGETRGVAGGDTAARLDLFAEKHDVAFAHDRRVEADSISKTSKAGGTGVHAARLVCAGMMVAQLSSGRHQWTAAFAAHPRDGATARRAVVSALGTTVVRA
jgi:hypothetical protein